MPDTCTCNNKIIKYIIIHYVCYMFVRCKPVPIDLKLSLYVRFWLDNKLFR
jgi:hypothetical protein